MDALAGFFTAQMRGCRVGMRCSKSPAASCGGLPHTALGVAVNSWRRQAADMPTVRAVPVQGMWRTPHPDPNPTAPYAGLSGAVPVSMTYHRDGTLLFMERPHGPYQSGQQNPLLVNVRRPFFPAAGPSPAFQPPPVEAVLNMS